MQQSHPAVRNSVIWRNSVDVQGSQEVVEGGWGSICRLTMVLVIAGTERGMGCGGRVLEALACID